MALLKILDKNQIADLLEFTAESGASILEELGKIDKTGIPYAKIVKFLADKSIEIKDENKALAHALRISFFMTFFEACKNLENEIELDEKSFKNLKENSKKYIDTQIDDFLLEKREEFIENKEWKRLLQLLKENLTQTLPENLWIKIEKHLIEKSYLNFKLLVYDFTARYKKVQEKLESKTLSDEQEFIRKRNYEGKLRSYYEQVVMNNEKGLTLKDLYVEPRIGVFKGAVEKGQEKYKEFLYPYQNENHLFIPLKIKVQGYTHEFLKGKDICQIKKRTPKVLFLLGQPGQGKSSFCYRLLYDLLTDKPHLKPVFFVGLRHITNTPSLLESPLDTIFNHIEEVHKFNISKVDKKKCILILDGLDELQMKENFGVDKVDAFCTALIRASKGENMDVHILLTSRYYIGLEKFTSQDVLIVNIQGFDIEEQQQWIHYYDTNSWLLKEFDNIYNNELQHLIELMEQPLLLYMLAQLQHPEFEHLTRANLYDRLFTELIERNYYKQNNSESGKLEIYKEKGIEVEDIREMVREIAYQIANTHKATFLPSQFLKKVQSVQKFLEKLYGKFEETKIESALRGVMMTFYFNEIQHNQHEVSKTAIEFLHLSLQEYMTAEYLWENIKNEFTAKTTKGGKENYEINTSEKALSVVFKLFHATQYKPEILDYLQEIIERDKSTDIKKVAFERLMMFLSDLFERDFLDGKVLLESHNQNNPIEKAFNTFYYYWHILRWANINHKIIVPEKIINMVRLNNIYERKFDFSNTNLKKIDFSYCILKTIKLFKADLQGADLQGAQLQGADLQGAQLQGAQLQGANLYKADLQGADLQGSQLQGAKLQNADLQGAELQGAELQGAKLQNANLQGTNLQGANLQGANLHFAKLQKANLEKVNLQGVNLQFANLQFANLRWVDLKNTNLKDTNLLKTDIRGSVNLTDEQRKYALSQGAILK